jgi:chromate transporter
VLHVPLLSTLNVVVLVLAVAAILALFRFKVGMIAPLIGCSIVGIIIHSVGVI